MCPATFSLSVTDVYTQKPQHLIKGYRGIGGLACGLALRIRLIVFSAIEVDCSAEVPTFKGNL